MSDPETNDNDVVWTEYQDDEGRTYYYNDATQESAWELPPDAIVQQPPPDDEAVDEAVDADADAVVKEEEDQGDGAGTPTYDDDDNNKDANAFETEDGQVKEEDAAADIDANDDVNVDNHNDNENDNDNANVEKESMENTKDTDIINASEWSRYQDDEGRDYYYNATTQETQWERPEGFVDAGPDPEENAGEGYDESIKQEGEEGEEQEYTNGPDDDDGDAGMPSPSYQQSPTHDNDNDNDDDNDDDDDGITSSPGAEEMHGVKEENQHQLTPEHRSPTPEPSPSPEQPQSPPKDPQQIAMENAQSFLSKPDAVMEPDATIHLLTLAQASDAQTAMNTLLTSCVNETAICGVLSKWLVDLKTANYQHSSSTTHGHGHGHGNGTNISVEFLDEKKLFQSNAETVRRLVEQVIAKTAKSNFTEKAQQTLLDLTRKERQFFDEMMEHERWRRLLIDLSAEHKNSALLTLLLKSISNKGYHREIAKRINQSDYFEVFHGMLSSELGLLGKLAVNGGKASADELNVVNSAETIVNDLKRQSTTTAYTYIYVMELLEELISKSKMKASASALKGPQALGLARATHKWERLREDIMEHMIKPAEDSGALSSFNPLSRKRRADLALTASEIYQRQRRRVRISNSAGGDGVVDGGSKSDQLGYSVESGVIEALKKYSRNTTVDEALLDQLLYNPYTDKSMAPEQIQNKLGGLLYNHALATEYLLRSLFLKKSRSKSDEMRLKCSKLISMSVLSAQKALESRARGEDASTGNVIEVDPIASLSKMVLEGSKLCEQIENVVNFVATEDLSGDTSTSSVGAKLSNLCIKCSTVAQGFLLWARERTNNNEFANTAAYPGTAPGILSLLRIIVNHHPLLRGSAIDIALLFLDHSNSELTYQKMNDIKEQALRVLLIVATKGLAVDVFNAVGSKLKNERSKIDAGLIRYFVAGTLEIMRPPLSLSIVRSMGGMLLSPKCTEALNVIYFDSAKKQKLSDFMGYFGDSVSNERSKFARSTQNDRAIATALKNAYAFDKK